MEISKMPYELQLSLLQAAKGGKSGYIIASPERLDPSRNSG
jgi:hypothetical protein